MPSPIRLRLQHFASTPDALAIARGPRDRRSPRGGTRRIALGPSCCTRRHRLLNGAAVEHRHPGDGRMPPPRRWSAAELSRASGHGQAFPGPSALRQPFVSSSA